MAVQWFFCMVVTAEDIGLFILDTYPMRVYNADVIKNTHMGYI